ncbi:MAG: riboflavin synthase [Stappiaceae bacterium]
MFTGIITDVGKILTISDIPAGRRTRIATRYDPAGIEIGCSIACGGPCHTVVSKGGDNGTNWFEVESAAETLALTTAGDWKQDDDLNLERSLKMGDELGGHLVLGHVDGTALITERNDHADSRYLKFKTVMELARFIPRKGSVSLDGTSLTVNEAAGTEFSVFLIPHTLEQTTWGNRDVGDRVNLEVDMMARYIARLGETQ